MCNTILVNAISAGRIYKRKATTLKKGEIWNNIINIQHTSFIIFVIHQMVQCCWYGCIIFIVFICLIYLFLILQTPFCRSVCQSVSVSPLLVSLSICYNSKLTEHINHEPTIGNAIYGWWFIASFTGTKSVIFSTFFASDIRSWHKYWTLCFQV